MIIHFICRGNAFRSRMAEAYFNSLKIPSFKAISSGTVAQLHSKANKPNFITTQLLLEGHGLKEYTKSHWDQLTSERLKEGDLTIFLNENVKDECQKLFGLPDNYIVWDIPDFNETIPTPSSSSAFNEFTESTYSQIASMVDDLTKELSALS
jgi:protein-tyrosine-phosphatase